MSFLKPKQSFLSRLLSSFEFFPKNTPEFKCRIVEVNTSTQEVVIHVINKAVYIRTKIAESIADLNVINNLAPVQACWLGGYYGRILRAALEGGQALKEAKKMHFLLSNKRGRYKIVFQNRNGDIGYYDQETRQEFVEHPLTIVNNDHIISEFDSSQACYIGMMAGISIERAASSGKTAAEVDSIMNRPPKLRIVK